MKYTRSKDGVERTTLWTSLRVTREEYAQLKERAGRPGLNQSVHELLYACLQQGLSSEYETWREELEYEEEERARKADATDEETDSDQDHPKG